ncbi:hypothetical protein FP515_16325 [Geobacillus thermoleovorans]|uniref:Uncharacterized protein n=1 Tax=Bacillus caldolyticus TaxID=1394 RepID=A0ABM6QPQ6_BACCL|nr:hypothetical protein CWI35_12770 [[Bacillus] caldolyticus]QCK80989.1 hypothetical protein E5Z46_00510 [Geobacillus kaustophilus NBRC 102445]QDY74570.1 hypothetical protein FP515_16325 [Geobacillus thermoleovorans]TRY43223.1 hypothetical protein FOI67_07980 [Geobacillus sp. LEMMJ02]
MSPFWFGCKFMLANLLTYSREKKNADKNIKPIENMTNIPFIMFTGNILRIIFKKYIITTLLKDSGVGSFIYSFCL